MQIPTYNENRNMELNNHAKEAIAYCGLVLWMLAVLGASVYLSVHTGNYKWMWLLLLLLCTQIKVKEDPEDKPSENQWHDYNETPENKSYVLAYLDGKYVVLFYRDALYEYPPYYDCKWAGTNRVDRWMYIPGNVKSD